MTAVAPDSKSSTEVQLISLISGHVSSAGDINLPESENSTSESFVIEPLLTVRDVAAILKVSERTIRYWRSQGVMPEPDVVLKSTIRWRTATIDRWLDTAA